MSSGYFAVIRLRASSFGTHTTVFVSGNVLIFAPTALICDSVASGDCSKNTLTTTSLRTWSVHELTQEKRAMNRPSRNIPIRTVIVAATVVERFAPMERNASLKKSLALGITQSCTGRGARPG